VNELADRPSVESILSRHPFLDYQWVDPAQIIVAQWVRMKCQFGCPHFGKAAACPPNTPGVDECRRFFTEYRDALLFHFEMTAPEADARRAWSARTNRALVDLERDVFLAGFPKAFALFTDACQLCEDCLPQRAECRQPALARPSATGMAIDVFGTARSQGRAIAVLTEPSAAVDYFAFLMVD
jgi:predicted metal-binding protein